MNKHDLRKIMPYDWNKKKQRIGSLHLINPKEGIGILILPVYRIILDSRSLDDLKVMAWEEKERCIMFSEVLLDENKDEVSVDYIIEDLPKDIQEAIEQEILNMYFFAKDGIDVNRYYTNINAYYNHINKQDKKTLKIIEDLIENNTDYISHIILLNG